MDRHFEGYVHDQRTQMEIKLTLAALAGVGLNKYS